MKSAFGSAIVACVGQPIALSQLAWTSLFSRIELPGYYVCKGSGRIGCGINEGLGQDAHQSLTELDRGLQGRSVRCLSTCRLTAAAAVRREFATQAGDRLPRQIPRTLTTRPARRAAHR